MPKTHNTKPGDCLASLAEQNGFADYQRIYSDAANAALKSSRPNPNVLAEGDAVVIPDLVAKSLSITTDNVHSFKLNSVPTLLRIRILDGAGAGIAGLQYELKVGTRGHTGTTPADGKIEHPILAADLTGTLQLWKKKEPGIDGYLFPLELGSLEPESVDRSCQARLLNLGFDCGPLTGALDERTKQALRGFQKKGGIPVNGTLDASTRSTLRTKHEGP